MSRPRWSSPPVPPRVYRMIARAQIDSLLEQNRKLRTNHWQSSMVPLRVKLFRAVLKAIDEHLDGRGRWWR